MKSFFLLFLTAALFSLSFIKKGDSAIRIDGQVADDEWKGATEHELKRGGRLLIKKQGTDLYVAMVAQKKAWAHVYLSHSDTVRVLHASAALGEARYIKKDGRWRPIQSFTWELRDRVYSEELSAKQDDHYRRHGWVANNNNTGNGMTFEFKLDLSHTGQPAPLACLVSEIPFDPHYFPEGLKDDTILPRLIQGYTPDSLSFDPGSWKMIQ